VFGCSVGAHPLQRGVGSVLIPTRWFTTGLPAQPGGTGSRPHPVDECPERADASLILVRLPCSCRSSFVIPSRVLRSAHRHRRPSGSRSLRCPLCGQRGATAWSVRSDQRRAGRRRCCRGVAWPCAGWRGPRPGVGGWHPRSRTRWPGGTSRHGLLGSLARRLSITVVICWWTSEPVEVATVEQHIDLVAGKK
jgi:hypothetical protein